MVDRIDIQDLAYKIMLSPRDPTSSPISSDCSGVIYRPSSFKGYIDLILDKVHANELCYNILKKYVHESIQMCDFVISLIKTEMPYSLVGFALCIIKDDALIIDLMCTNSNYYKHIGAILMNAIKEVAKHIHVNKITANSVFKISEFYYKQDFVNNITKPIKSNSKPLVYTLKGGKQRASKSLRNPRRSSRRSRAGSHTN
jgi:hypothetical protein